MVYVNVQVKVVADLVVVVTVDVVEDVVVVVLVVVADVVAVAAFLNTDWNLCLEYFECLPMMLFWVL